MSPSHSSPPSLLFLSFSTLGIVYGDIGTSCLYVLTSVFQTNNIETFTAYQQDTSNTLWINDVQGIASMVIWSIVVLVCVKYVTFVMSANNNGEGGTFALYSLLSRSLPNESDKNNTMGNVMDTPDNAVGESHMTRQKFLYSFLAMFGSALLISDGLITPAISILSAVEGISIWDSNLQPMIIPIALGLLVILFSGQRMGTEKIGYLFSPIMLLWFIMLFCVGITLMIQYSQYTGILLTALSPHCIVLLVIRRGWSCLSQLGAVVLCVTGCEAMFSDMSHFGRKPIVLSWYLIVFPALIVNYLGQCAWLLGNPLQVQNVFYQSLPYQSITFLPVLLLATLSTIIASQALISGSFSVIKQAVNLHFLPNVTVHHTSEFVEGQIFVPTLNIFLLVSTMAIVITFRSSQALASAYGLAVCCVFVITSIFFISVQKYHWRLPLYKILSYAIPVMSVDIIFLIANVSKFLSGGFLPLLISACLTFVMVIHTWGRHVVAREQRGSVLSTEGGEGEKRGELQRFSIIITNENLKEVEMEFKEKEQEQQKDVNTMGDHIEEEDGRFRGDQQINGNMDPILTLPSSIPTHSSIPNDKDTFSPLSPPSPSMSVTILPHLIGVFFSRSPHILPIPFLHVIRQLHFIPKISILFTAIFSTTEPRVPKDKRMVMRKLNGRDVMNIIRKDDERRREEMGNGMIREIPAGMESIQIYQLECHVGFSEGTVEVRDICEEFIRSIMDTENKDQRDNVHEKDKEKNEEMNDDINATQDNAKEQTSPTVPEEEKAVSDNHPNTHMDLLYLRIKSRMTLSASSAETVAEDANMIMMTNSDKVHNKSNEHSQSPFIHPRLPSSPSQYQPKYFYTTEILVPKGKIHSVIPSLSDPNGDGDTLPHHPHPHHVPNPFQLLLSLLICFFDWLSTLWMNISISFYNSLQRNCGDFTERFHLPNDDVVEFKVRVEVGNGEGKEK